MGAKYHDLGIGKQAVRLETVRMKDPFFTDNYGACKNGLDVLQVTVGKDKKDPQDMYEEWPQLKLFWDERGCLSFEGKEDFSRMFLRCLPLNKITGGGTVKNPRHGVRFANFSYADLMYSNLEYLTLKGCDFTGAYLHGANFRNTTLREANLDRTICYATDFREARFDATSFEEGVLLEHSYWDRFVPPLETTVKSDAYEKARKGICALSRLAVTKNKFEMMKHMDELDFVSMELQRLKEMRVDCDSWREFTDSWNALKGILEEKKLTSSKAISVIIEIFGLMDDQVESSKHDDNRQESKDICAALGMASQLYGIRGVAPSGLLLVVQTKLGRALRSKDFFPLLNQLSIEVNCIQQVISFRSQLVTGLQNGVLSIMIGATNYLSNLLLASDMYQDLTD